MSFIGKEYILERQENFDAFVNSTEMPEEYKKALINHKPTVKFTKDGDKYTMTTLSPTGQYQTVTFQSGVEFDDAVLVKPCKTTFTVNGDTVTQVQKFDQGTITFKREFSGNQLVMTINTSTWDGTAKRYYKLV